MDATASIINIAQITGTLIEYLRAATQASSDRRKLLLEAHSLVALLNSLKDFLAVDDQHMLPEWREAVFQLATDDGPFAQYERGLQSLLKKVHPRQGFEKVAQTILWKLAKEDVNEMLSRIERLKSLIAIALEMDHTRLSNAMLVQVSDISRTAGDIRSDTRTLVNAADNVAFRGLLDRICLEDYAAVFQSNITEHTASIGQNFIASSEFESWAGPGDASTTLLCLGDPGIGKTVMSTKAIQALQKASDKLRQAVIFVYCDCTRRRSRLNRRDSSPEARSKGVQTPGHFVASLLRQLLEAHGSPIQAIQEMMDRHDRQKTRPKMEELKQAFSEVAQTFDKIYVVVDAMDECDSLEMEAFATHLLSICSTPAMRLLVTTRKHAQIDQMFEDSVRLEMRPYDNDTMQYLQSRARREFPPRVLRDTKALDKILSALLLSANGIPLIARLHMNALRGLRTPGAMLAEIARLTSNTDVYDETYQAAMERITKQPGELPVMAMRVLRWIVCAKRYLYARELQCVLAIYEDSDYLDEDFVPDMHDVFLACEGLVCVVFDATTDTARIELVHTTARQYFDRNLAEWAPDVSLDLTRTCLNMLSFQDLSPVPRTMVIYAWRYWGEHAKEVEELKDEEQFDVLASIVRNFFARDQDDSPLSRTVTITEQRPYHIDIFQEDLTGYHLTAKFGLTRLFEALWDPDDHLDVMLGKPEYDRNPLQQAIVSENVETVKAMLRLRSIDPNAKNKAGISSTQHAILYQNAEIVEALLESDMAGSNDIDSAGKPLALRAAEMHQERVSELFMSADRADAQVRDMFSPSLVPLASADQDERYSRYLSPEQMREHLVKTGANTRDLEDLPFFMALRARLEMATYGRQGLPFQEEASPSS